MAITKEELQKLQEEDESLQKLVENKNVMHYNGYTVSFKKKNGILFRLRQANEGNKNPVKQILVPMSLRKKVMSVAHDSIFGGHMGIRKTEDRILINFYWPRLHNDVTSFCRSCDICQKTVSKGSVTRVPLGEMPLVDMPFKSRC